MKMDEVEMQFAVEKKKVDLFDSFLALGYNNVF